MTKKEFIKALAAKQGIKQTKASEILEDFKGVLMSELVAGNKVHLGDNFGTFKPITRTGVVPRTNKKYSTKSIKLCISAPFKKSLN